MTEQEKPKKVKGRKKWLAIGATIGVAVTAALEAVGIIPHDLGLILRSVLAL